MIRSYENAIAKYSTRGKGRIWELDFIRGICLLLMVFDHLAFNLATTFSFIANSGFGLALTTFANTYLASPLRYYGWPIAVATFVLLCGISTGLSRNNLLRGLRLFAVAYAITFVLTFSDLVFYTRMAINFGVLHTLAYSILIYTLTTGNSSKIKLFNHDDVTITLQEVMLSVMAICAICVTIGYSVPLKSDSLFPVYDSIGKVSFSQYYHFALGIKRDLLLSTDYIPLLPWLGVFCIGCILSIRLYPDKKSLFESRNSLSTSFISKIGRKSLLVYIVHQPIIYLVLGLLSLVLTGRFI